MLILLLALAAPLPPAKTPKPEPPYPVPGRYIVQWGTFRGEAYFYSDGTFWYMYGRTMYVGFIRFDLTTNKIYWCERLSTTAPGNETEYIFQMDNTGFKGKNEHGVILAFEKWDPKRTDFVKGE